MFFRSTRLGKDFELTDGRMVIGRLKNCDIELKSPSVSKQHLEVEVTGGEVRVRDKDSRNNSCVNSEPIRGLGWIELKDKDVVDVCGFDFRFLREKQKVGTSGACIIETGESDSVLSAAGSRSIPLSRQGLGDVQQFSQLQALLAITSTLRDVLETEDVLERTVKILFQIFPAVDRAAICFVDDEQVVTPQWWQVREGDPDTTIRISQNIGQHVAGTSEAVITNNAMADFNEAESVYALSMRSVMCCPLVDAKGKVFGLIHVDSARPNMFSDLDLEVLAAVAMQVSLAINCSRLHAIAVEDELLRQDVERASEVQQRYLPDSPPAVEGYDLAGFYRAARHVGGDYFDYVTLPDGRIVIVLGDVVGKGVPAALTMVRLATETRAGLEVCRTPKELVSRLNQKFYEDFITLAVLVLDPNANHLTISNAGHEPPLLRAIDGGVSAIGFEISGCPVGVLEDYIYEESTVPIAPGESLIVFSDGFPDAQQEASDRRFGTDPIAELFGRFCGTASQTIDHLVDQVDQFINGNTQFDDMCMVCLKRNV